MAAALDYASTSLVPCSRSLDLRDKALKVVAYAAKLGALHSGSPKFASIAKQVSSARKICVLLHWVKYSDDARAALKQTPSTFQALSILETALTCMSDMASDVATLGSLHVLPISSARIKTFEWCGTVLDIVYCVVAMVTSAVHLARQQTALLTTPISKRAGAEHKLFLKRMGLIKYCCDFVKDCHGLDLRGLNGTGVPATLAISAGLASGVMSTHKWLDKLKPPPLPPVKTAAA